MEPEDTRLCERDTCTATSLSDPPSARHVDRSVEWSGYQLGSRRKQTSWCGAIIVMNSLVTLRAAARRRWAVGDRQRKAARARVIRARFSPHTDCTQLPQQHHCVQVRPETRYVFERWNRKSRGRAHSSERDDLYTQVDETRVRVKLKPNVLLNSRGQCWRTELLCLVSRRRKCLLLLLLLLEDYAITVVRLTYSSAARRALSYRLSDLSLTWTQERGGVDVKCWQEWPDSTECGTIQWENK